jgi:DNA-binding transcriptional LysR family regulator
MLSITTMNLSAVDLNLLVVLHAVLEERSATRAAKKLNVTQSAVSNALARLRAVLGDPLVVRSGRGIVATPRALELAPTIREVMAKIEGALDRGSTFVPEQTTRTFTFAAADNNQVRDVPFIAAAFARRLPRAKLRIVSVDFLVATDGLATGEVDATFMPTAGVPEGYRSEHVFDEASALLVCKDHPRVRGPITPKLFGELAHIDVEVVLGRRGVGNKAATEDWKRKGLVRNVAMIVPYFTTAALIASRTDCVAGVPLRAAEVFCQMLPVRIARTTFPLPSLPMSLTWHERTDADPGATYFRRVLVESVRDPDCGDSHGTKMRRPSKSTRL